ncbi:hypothetical protein RN001_011165 [Aquatica leii]|uniref:SANT domain-containing protein n=1 Tax=Aquatica leii TaxID=1421715 RepID=A0AAN7PVP4_9COLE|nr:hypothetical protein RN001_011165 [Aquatica leii]
MPYPQRQPPTHRPNHSQQSDLYKPSRSPLTNAARYPYPVSPQLQTSVAQVTNQRYNVPPTPTFPPAGYRDYRQPRISLLHPEYSSRAREQMQGGQLMHHMDSMPGQQPYKKMRLQDQKDMQPLRVDTRESSGAYNPQVEAISPTLPDHIQEDQAFRSTKDELLQQIGKVDREIAKAEAQISILKKKQQELEELALKPLVKQEQPEDTQPKHQSLAQKIYAENRKRAQNAHAKLDTLGPKLEFPLYNQPSDSSLYQDNWRKHVTFKKRLLEYFKKRHAEKESRNSYLTETYSKLMQEWLRKVDKIESGVKRKAKEAKNRDFFEKVFPELRKQREDKERFNRVGARIKSEADLEEIMDNLQEQALEDKKMRSYAVIPPILLDTKERKIVYKNNNGHIVDMEVEYKSRQFLNVWTPSEKELFKEKYLQHPKNFGVIASYLDRKSVADCVQYYYLSKKTENYKQLLRKSRQRTRSSRNNTQKVNSSASTSVVDILTTGVTTRLQREQQKTTVQQNRDSLESTCGSVVSVSGATSTNGNPNSPLAPSNVSTSSSPPLVTSSTTINSVAVTTTTTPNLSLSTAVNVPVSKSPKPADNIAVSGDNSKSFSDFNLFDDSDGKKAPESVDGNNKNTGDAPVQGIISIKKEIELMEENNISDHSLTSNETKKKKERRKDKENMNVESSEDEPLDIQDKSVQGQCLVCGSQLGPQLQSRPLIPSHATLYGLKEDQVPANARVCNMCRCKSVRSRYTHCPLPNCPNSRGRIKRLRSFPQRLMELPSDVRDPILAEFHVPSGVSKCCSACFSRFQRRLGPVEEWPEDDVNQLRSVLTEVGANWQLIGERLSKSPQQVRNFYAANRKRLNLEMCLGDRKPALTDEEESGSSTSSCEEPMQDNNSSDTASAGSPPAITEQIPQLPIKKEDYDSSATETADEGQTPDHYQSSATITVVNNDGQPRQNSSPLTVKDLMLNVIEFSLMKNAGSQQSQHPPTSGLAPTISSILNNDSNEVTIVSEYNLNNMQPPRGNRNEISITKLVTPLIAATITPVPASGSVSQPPPQQEHSGRDDLVVFQVQDNREPETLDLSIKKPRELPPPAHAKLQPQMHRSEAYGYHQERNKSPALYVSTIPRVQPKLPSPKLANPKAGSITLGTPIISQPRYEGLLRQMTPEPKMGSITQGTPIHVPHMQDKRLYDYYNKRPMPHNVPPQSANYPSQYRQPAYSVEQQLSSRQIIMNDYITSQQMLGRRNDKPQYYATSPHRTPPPQQTQQRQGVIQRHTRPHYPPGHEALSSLVDVAVQQPNLPVPNSPHEGLGKTMADNLLEQPHRFQMIQHQQQLRQQQQRLEAERRAYHQQQQQQQARHQQQASRSSDSSITAASLIDAIITHQINQAAEGGREVVSNNREPPRPGDRLFQSFHRDQPAPQTDNNGERSPSVISVDLDNEPTKSLTIKELADTVISHDFGARQTSGYYHHQDNINEQWKRRMQQQQQKEDSKRSATPQQDERQIIRIAQQQKYHVEPVSPPETNHWSEPNYRRYQQPQSHISALDYVKNRIVEVMRTEDDKKEVQESHHTEKERNDSPGEMVIDEEKHENDFPSQQPTGFAYPYVTHKPDNTANDNSRNTEPKPLLSAQYEPLSDED